MTFWGVTFALAAKDPKFFVSDELLLLRMCFSHLLFPKRVWQTQEWVWPGLEKGILRTFSEKDPLYSNEAY